MCSDTPQLTYNCGRSRRGVTWRPTAPGYAALAIATKSMVATHCTRLRRACDRHEIRPAKCPRSAPGSR
ncbi:hypothetical protein BST31_02515 [Mycobacterium marseillense]|nr:hypothetical protein BST31_02515 [Mycobacterium marseillense]